MSLRVMLARWVFGLPQKWIYRLAGGAPIEIDGKVMDPHCQLMVKGAARGPDIAEIGVVAAREQATKGIQMIPPAIEPGVTRQADEISLRDYSLPVRIYRPENQDPEASVMVYYHSGGGVIGDLEFCDAFCAMLCAEGRRPVISVDYRLGPEHKWPAGVDDAVAAYKWALGRAEDLGAPPGRACVAGDSMGGNYAAVVCQDMKLEGAPPPDFQLLIYPATHMGLETESMRLFQDIYPLTKDVMAFFRSCFLSDDADTENPRLSPLASTDLTELPPAIVVTAGFDAILDQGRLYHERLQDAGVSSTYRSYDSLVHGFVSLTALSPQANRACREIARMTAGFRG